MKLNYQEFIKIEQESKDLNQRKIRPDIVIGFDRIIIEVKDNSGLNGIYRLFYQAFKYRKKSVELLVLFNYSSESDGVLTSEEKNYLENLPSYKIDKTMVKVIQRRK